MLHAIIMAGGSGTRFWPASRANRPKQILPVTGQEPLVVQTIRRLFGLIPEERITIVTGARQAEPLRAVLPKPTRVRLVAEPEPRDTAPCVALAALLVAAEDPEGVMAVLPADHAISPAVERRDALAAAATAAEAGHLVAFGIPPRSPATGFGYIHQGEPVLAVGGRRFFKIQAFKEKPDEATARAWLAAGGYFWNSGMFVWKASTILEEIARHAPELWRTTRRLEQALGRPEWPAVLAEELPRAPRQSVDREIMERSDRAVVLPAAFDWDDLGAWSALPAHHAADQRGNTAFFPAGGRHVDLESRDLIVHSSAEHVIATLGLCGITIVHTPDATLICPTERAQDVKALTEELRKLGLEDLL